MKTPLLHCAVVYIVILCELGLDVDKVVCQPLISSYFSDDIPTFQFQFSTKMAQEVQDMTLDEIIANVQGMLVGT